MARGNGGAPAADAMLPAQLAGRGLLTLGTVRLHPALRTLQGPDVTVTLEPRVVQVLVELADAAGEVVTRDRLARRCWAGQVVAEDSLNRVISLLRRAAREVGGGLVIETIPKTGYRLALPAGEDPAAPASPPRRWSRRDLALGGTAALAVVAGGGMILAGRHPARPAAVQALLDRGRTALRDKLPDSTQQGIGFFRQAVAQAPDDAEAWGLLAMAWCSAVEFAPGEEIAATVSACEDASRRALVLQPDQPDALAARALLPPAFGDWWGAERRLRAVLARWPDQLDALDGLALVYFSAGLTARAMAVSSRLIALDPLSPVFSYRHAYRLWTAGDVGAADRLVDRALQLWPRHPAVNYARFLLFALTGRVEAALRLLRGSAEAAPLLGGMPAWEQTLLVLAKRGDRAMAVAANLAAARAGLGNCTNAILALTALGDLDAAFAVADGYLLDRGPMAGEIDRGPHLGAVNDQRWRKTMMLFIPPTAPLRADCRFAGLCAGMGLADYWRRAGVRPDWLRG